MSFYTPLLEYGYKNLAIIHPGIVNSMCEQSNSWLERMGPRNAVEGLPLPLDEIPPQNGLFCAVTNRFSRVTGLQRVPVARQRQSVVHQGGSALRLAGVSMTQVRPAW